MEYWTLLSFTSTCNIILPVNISSAMVPRVTNYWQTYQKSEMKSQIKLPCITYGRIIRWQPSINEFRPIFTDKYWLLSDTYWLSQAVSYWGLVSRHYILPSIASAFHRIGLQGYIVVRILIDLLFPDAYIYI